MVYNGNLKGVSIMHVGVDVGFSFMTIIFTIINLALIGLGIYVVYLVIKALRIYIKKNSDK